MVKKVIDARTLACPEPVMLTMKAMKEADEVVTIVDSEVARDNVSQLAKGQGWKVEIEKKEDGIHLTLTRGAAVVEEKRTPAKGVVVVIASEFLGRGELTQLGSVLMQSFLHSLNGLSARPETVIFINSGVKLVTRDSLSQEDLRRLNESGVELLACGTCLSYFGLIDRVAVGQVSNMATIAETLLHAEKVINL